MMRGRERERFLRQLAQVGLYAGIAARTLVLVLAEVNAGVNCPPLPEEDVLRIAADEMANVTPTRDEIREEIERFISDATAEMV